MIDLNEQSKVGFIKSQQYIRQGLGEIKKEGGKKRNTTLKECSIGCVCAETMLD